MIQRSRHVSRALRRRRLLIALAATVLTLAGVEGVARIGLSARFLSDAPVFELFGTPFCRIQYDSVLGWKNVPSSENRYRDHDGRDLTQRNNAMGLRGPEVGPKDPGVPRVLILGDSMTWGWGVGDGDSFADVLRERLSRSATPAEVLNAAVTGYGTDQELLLLRRLGPALRPDLVVLVFYENDRWDNNAAWAYNTNKPVFAKAGGGLVLRNTPCPYGVAEPKADEVEGRALRPRSWLFGSAAYRLLLTRSASNTAAASWLTRVGLATESVRAQDVTCTDDVTGDLLVSFGAEVSKLGADWLLVYTPNWLTVPRDGAAGPRCTTDAYILSMFREHLFSFVDLYEELRVRGETEDRIRIPANEHWNPAGHRAVADVLEPIITSKIATRRPKYNP